MILLMKCVQEENNVNRLMKDIHDESWIDKIIVIDGGSNDHTVQDLKKFDKVNVYVHEWLPWYHDCEISQSNIALSYVPHGKICFILDFDERISPELKDELAQIDKDGMPRDADIGDVPRRTFDLMRHEDSPHAIIDDDGWPLISHQIGQYPDLQCRLIRRRVGMTWVNSPHHSLMGFRSRTVLKGDVIHFEKEDLRERIRIERKWARLQARRKELGLIADVFEGRVRPEVHKYTDPGEWA